MKNKVIIICVIIGGIYIFILFDVLFYIFYDIVSQLIVVVEVGVVIFYFYVCDLEIGVLMGSFDVY